MISCAPPPFVNGMIKESIIICTMIYKYTSSKWGMGIEPKSMFSFVKTLTHCGRVTHICVRKQTINGSDNGLSPDRRQAIIWTNAGLLLIRPLGTNFSEILIEILTFSFKKIRLKVSSAKRRPFCLGLNVLTHWHLRDEALKLLILKLIQKIYIRIISREIAPRWILRNLTKY